MTRESIDLEPFCLSCHDLDGALATAVTSSAFSPFNDGATLGTMPYIASTSIASAWAGSSVHRSRDSPARGPALRTPVAMPERGDQRPWIHK